MILEVIAIGLLALFIALGLWRFYLLQIGASHAKARKLQTLAIVMGIGAALGVIVAGAVSGDASAIAYERAHEARSGGVDIVIADGHSNRTAFVEAILASSSDIISATAVGYDFGEIDALAGGSLDYTYLVDIVDGYTDVVDWVVLDGDPDWSSGVVVPRSTARDLRTSVGDTVSFYPTWGGPTEQFRQTQHVWTERATLALTLQHPDGSYIHSDDDIYRFEVASEANLTYFRVIASLDDGRPPEGQVLRVTAPNGTVYEDERALTVEVEDAFLAPGQYIVEIHAAAAFDNDYTIEFQKTNSEGRPPWDDTPIKPYHIDLAVTAIVEDSSMPSDRSPSVLVHRDLLVAIGHERADHDPASEAFIKVRPGADTAAIKSSLIEQLGLQDEYEPITDLAEERAYRAEETRAEHIFIWSIIGGMTLAAGLALIFVLMSLLVEERRRTLAALRTLGATRGALTRMHVAEAAVYGLAALVPAVAIGITLAGVFNFSFDFDDPTRDLVVRPVAILAGAGLALVLVLGAASIAAARAGRMHLASALRDEERPVSAATWPKLVGGGILLLLGLAMIPAALAGGAVSLTLGPTFLILALAAGLSMRLPRHAVFPIAGALILIWLVLSRTAVSDIDTVREGLLLPGRALMFCAAAAMLFVYARPVHAALSWPFRKARAGAPLEVALAYLRGRPGRVAMSMFVLSLILLGVTFIGALAPSDDGGGWYSMGGFDAVGATNTPMDVEAALLEAGDDPFRNAGLWASTQWLSRGPLLGTDPEGRQSGFSGAVTTADLALLGPGRLFVEEGPAIETVFQRLSDEPGTIAVTRNMVGNIDVGDQYYATGWQSSTEPEVLPVTIIAILAPLNHDMPAMWTGRETMAMLAALDDKQVMTAVWATADGVTPDQLALEIELGFTQYGLRMHDREIDHISPMVAKLFSTFTVLTLTIGAIALGLITARNAAIRRRQIGALRAVGAQQGQVVWMVMVETVYVVAVAVVVGVMGAWLSLVGIGTQLPYDIPWAWTLSLGGYAVLAGAVAAALPAWFAARMDPAQAARYVE